MRAISFHTWLGTRALPLQSDAVDLLQEISSSVLENGMRASTPRA